MKDIQYFFLPLYRLSALCGCDTGIPIYIKSLVIAELYDWLTLRAVTLKYVSQSLTIRRHEHPVTRSPAFPSARPLSLCRLAPGVRPSSGIETWGPHGN